VGAERPKATSAVAGALLAPLILVSAGFAPARRPAAAEPDWNRLARDVAAETNQLRRDPASYLPDLEALLPRFDGLVLERPGRAFLRTEEGAAAVQEAVAALRRARSAGSLEWSAGLARAAGDHVRDQGPVGGTEHEGTDGSDPERAIANHMRVEAFIVAIDTAIAELMSANIASHQSGPQNCFASTNGISSVDPTRLSTSAVPHPRMSPHEQIAKKAPMITTE